VHVTSLLVRISGAALALALALGSPVMLAQARRAQAPPNLLIKGGHVIDPKNDISRVLDVAIAGGKIARVAENIPAAQAKTVADVSGLYVTPGLIDIHVHVFTNTPTRSSIENDTNVRADTISFPSGVTTVVDAGTSGWEHFEEFRKYVIDRSATRILAMLNITSKGMRMGGDENDPAGMDPEATARMAKKHADVVVGIKSAHYAGPGWASIDNAVKAGNLANVPVMVDFGEDTEQRTLEVLLREKLRPGDIYSHCFSGHRRELLHGKLNPAMEDGRKRGVLFDLGFGQASFYWYVAVPALKQGFRPDAISTDMHRNSLHGGMKSMVDTMSKILNLGVPLDDVIKLSTYEPAKIIKHPELGNLDVGAEADVAVLRLETGKFRLLDSAQAWYPGDRMLRNELTIRAGRVMWDRDGYTSQSWEIFPYRRDAESR
jgi:dihydroorotase